MKKKTGRNLAGFNYFPFIIVPAIDERETNCEFLSRGETQQESVGGKVEPKRDQNVRSFIR